jgi:tRNA(Ile)-lysidine synthase
VVPPDDGVFCDAQFTTQMARFGPFEQAPVVAVAVSGGADSMALALLAQRWLKACTPAGRLVALTVDHGLRPEAGAEAAQVGRWLAAYGIEHYVLVWRGDKPRRGVQAAARAARYGLLRGWCREHHVLHLLLAHHLEDQAETVLLRLARGSGVTGLAAMAGVVPGLPRLLRPLLTTPRAHLRALLKAAGQDWIEDPSNDQSKYHRVKARRALARLEPLGLTANRLAATAGHMARAAEALRRECLAVMAQAVRLHEAGYCLLDATCLASAPREVALRVLARVVLCVGGAAYTPRFERLERLLEAITSDDFAHGRTLGGCRLVPARKKDTKWEAARVLVCREPAAARHEIILPRGEWRCWDARFAVRYEGTAEVRVRRLGRTGWREILKSERHTRPAAVAEAARYALPAFWDEAGLLAAPHLGFWRADQQGRQQEFALRHAPRHALSL